MLYYILKNNWNDDLTKELCRNVQRTIKTRDILNCHSPILTCILICEFIRTVGESSVRHQSMCVKLINDLTSFCKIIQDSNPNEKYIKFIMTQKDLRGRTVFQIASENSFYLVLQTPEIGTIVKKMWNGRLIHDGFLSSSSLYRFLEDDSFKLSNPFNKFEEEKDYSKSFFYQFSLWKESCSMRYWPESISTIGLIIIYNIYIYFLVNTGQIMTVYTEIDQNLKIFLFIYVGWTGCINYNLINQLIFCKLSKRKFILDLWGRIEILIFIFALLLFVDTNYYLGTYDENKILIKSNEMSDFPFLARAIILSINDVLVWLRITGILLTFKDIGPLIRMISLLSFQTGKYLLVYSSYITCFSAIFTAIFYNVSNQFSTFSISFATLFGGFINNLDAFGFDSYHFFGAIMIIFYVTLSGIILINLLIALLSNVYRTLSLEVDASHRSVLISYFRRYKWNKDYGFLILLTTPVNIVNLFFLPIFYFLQKKYSVVKINLKICEIYFLIFYFPFMLVSFSFLNLFLFPFSYLKGIINIFIYEKQSKSIIPLKFCNIIKWIIIGPIFLVIITIKDIFYMFRSVFLTLDVGSSEKERIKKYISNDDVILFLQFIHSRSKEDRNDLHTLFIDFLLFEQEKKSERDATIKEKSFYLDKINNASQKNSKTKTKRSSSSYFVVNKSRGDINNKEINSTTKKDVSGSFVKRNIVVIEILENFLIDDGSDNYIVDIEKLKMLLPKTWNIDDNYIKRLVYTDITSLNKAVNKLKTSKNVILREQLLNKITTSMIELDKSVDNSNEKTKEHVKENDDFEEKQFYDDYLDLLQRISVDLKTSMESNKKLSNKKLSNIQSFKDTNKLSVKNINES